MKVLRTTQPNGVVRIDWGNPLARGLVFACVGGTPVDLVTGATPDTNSSTVEATKRGRMQITSTATPMVIPRTHRARPLITGEISMLIYGQNQSDVSWPRMAQIRDNDNTSLIFVEQESTVSYWGIHNLGGGNDFPGYSAPGYGKAPTGIGVPYQLGMAMKNNFFFRSVFNGQQIYEDTSGSYNFFVDDDVTTNVTWANGTGTFGNYLTAIWNRALAVGEFASLNDNPWQLFEPEAFDRKKVFLPPEVTVTSKRWHRVPRGETRVEQPSAPMELDWENPLLRGVEFVMVGSHPFYNPAKAPQLSGSAYGSTVATPKGKGAYVSSANSAWYVIRNPNTATGWTHAGVLMPLASYGGTQQYQAGLYNFAGEFDRSICTDASSYWNAYIYDGTTRYAQSSVQAIVGRADVVVAASDGANLYCKVNTAPEAVVACNNEGFTTYTGTVYFAFGAASNNALPATAIPLLVRVPRCWTEAERESFAANPWQIFRLDKLTLLDLQNLYPSLSLAELISLSTTQATPRVTITVP